MHELRATILYYMNAWNNTANVRFVETHRESPRSGSPETAGESHWSCIGTDILTFDPDEATMNLDDISPWWKRPFQILPRLFVTKRGIRLAFLMNITPSRSSIESTGRKRSLTFMKTQGWSRDQMSEQVLTPLDNSALDATARPYTKVPIMCYSLPAEIMKDEKAVGGGTEIDALDRKFAASVYPRRAVSCGAAVDRALNQRVIYQTPYGPGTTAAEIHELTWLSSSAVSGSWSHRDVTAEASAVAMTGTAIAALDSLLDADRRIYYRSRDGHVQELACNVQALASWSHRDVTADAKGVAAMFGSPIAAIRGANAYPRIYYLSADGHVHELAYFSSSWSHRDVTADAKGVAAMTGSGIAARSIIRGRASIT